MAIAVCGALQCAASPTQSQAAIASAVPPLTQEESTEATPVHVRVGVCLLEIVCKWGIGFDNTYHLVDPKPRLKKETWTRMSDRENNSFVDPWVQ